MLHLIKTKVQLLLANKLALFVMFLALCWAALDANTRFTDKNSKHIKENSQVLIATLNLPQLRQSDVSDINKRYQDYKNKKKQAANLPKTTNTLMSKEAQQQQQGELDSLYIDDKELVLKAIIANPNSLAKKSANNSRIALILVKNLTTNEQQISAFSEQNTVYGYQLVINSHKQITLTKHLASTAVQTTDTASDSAQVNNKLARSQTIVLSLYATK